MCISYLLPPTHTPLPSLTHLFLPLPILPFLILFLILIIIPVHTPCPPNPLLQPPRITIPFFIHYPTMFPNDNLVKGANSFGDLNFLCIHLPLILFITTYILLVVVLEGLVLARVLMRGAVGCRLRFLGRKGFIGYTHNCAGVCRW